MPIVLESHCPSPLELADNRTQNLIGLEQAFGGAQFVDVCFPQMWLVSSRLCSFSSFKSVSIASCSHSLPQDC